MSENYQLGVCQDGSILLEEKVWIWEEEWMNDHISVVFVFYLLIFFCKNFDI